MQVYALQYEIEWQNRDANIEKVRSIVEEAAPRPGSLIVLPEMGFSGFSMSPEKVADTEKLETESALLELAKAHASWVVGGVVSRAGDGRGRNEALVANPNGEIGGRYSKIHPFSPTGEHRRYEGGREITVVPCDGFQLAPFVCYDLRFPEIFRTAARRGANIMVVIANWPTARFLHWKILLRARAVENQAWVIGVNRCGSDPRFTYPGGTMIADPFGEVVAEAADTRTVVSAEISEDVVSKLRGEFPVLDDMQETWTHG